MKTEDRLKLKAWLATALANHGQLNADQWKGSVLDEIVDHPDAVKLLPIVHLYRKNVESRESIMYLFGQALDKMRTKTKSPSPS